MYQTCNKQVIN